MRLTNSYRRLLAIVPVISLSLAVSLFVPLARGGSRTDEVPPATAIRVTPPAPVFDDTARRAELAARRARVAEKVGPKGVLVLFSTEPRVYTNDVDYEYRQENNLFYLTHLRQDGATLVLIPGNSQVREILFLPRRNPAAETWTGHMYSAEEARRISGISEIWEDKEFEPFMRAVRARQVYRPKPEAQFMSAVASTSAASVAPTAAAAPPVPHSATGTTPPLTGFETLFTAMTQGDASLFLLVPRDAESREYKQEQRFAGQWSQSASGFMVRNAWPIFNEMRLRKSPTELQLLQHAIDITTEALGRAMAVAGRSQWEYEVEAEVEYTFKRRNADQWGYPSIVGCGPNATTLHYQASQGRVAPNDLLLMDVGAEYHHYTADITRTFPVSGRFTPAQAEIYNLVLAAQEASMRASRPGATLSEVHNASVEVIKDGLLRLGLITDRNSSQYRMWFMHGTSHWLGMNVHDVGVPGVKLEPGMVYTIEPGIYVREDALDYLPKTPENEKLIAAVRPAFEKYKNIGVRIEDDVVVTADGFKNLSTALPRTIPDIEAFIARAARELRASTMRPGGDLRAATEAPREMIFDAPPATAPARQLISGQMSFPSSFPLGQTVRRGFVFVGSAEEFSRYHEQAHDREPIE